MKAMQSVLVLEDEILIAELLQDWLLEQGCGEVLLSASVGEALRLLDEKSVDAAILDWTLKHETSAAVAQTLKQRGIPFVIASGRDGDELAGLGAPVLAKPFEYDAVQSALARLAAS